MDTSVKGQKYILEYEKLKCGDIILESGIKIPKKNTLENTKKHFLRSMICILPMSIIHAEKQGVFIRNPQRLLVDNFEDLKVLRPKTPLEKKDQDILKDFLKNKTGSLYSVNDEKQIFNTETNKRTQFCSRLIVQAYKEINYNIVNDISFCSASDIKSSDQFMQLDNIVRTATKEEIEFTFTKNHIEENQKSTYKWLKKVQVLARKKYKYYNIHNQMQIIDFLKKYSSADLEICKFIEESRYCENYMKDIHNNPHMYDPKLFVERYKNNILNSIYQEYENTISPKEMFIKDFTNYLNSYSATKFQFFEKMTTLYKNILLSYLSKYKMLADLCNSTLIKENNNLDKKLTIFLEHLDQNIHELQRITSNH